MQFIRAHCDNTACVSTYELSVSSTLTELTACINVCKSGPINILPNTELINQHSERHTAKCYLQFSIGLTAVVNIDFFTQINGQCFVRSMQ